MPAYTPNVPQANQTISSTQPQINNNFLQIPVWTNVDHVGISGAGGDEGKHNKVSFVNQVATTPTFTPSIVPSGLGTLGLYAKDYTVNGTTTTQLFANIVRKDATFTSSQIPFTASLLSRIQTPTSTSDGWTYLPSGILLKWGTSIINLNNFKYKPVNTNSGNNGPNFTQILNVQLTLKTSSRSVSYNNVIAVTDITAAGFEIVRMDNGEDDKSTTVNAYWLCIGY